MNKAKIFAGLLSMGVAGMVHAAEPTAQGLASLGWGCITISGEVACTPPGEPTVLEVNTMRKKPAAVLVMLFNAITPAFIGAENLIRADLYAGQGCPRAGKLEPYKFEMLGTGYFSCHQFEKDADL